MKAQPILLSTCILFLFSSCFLLDTGTSVIWTDTPELVAYAELFNVENQIARVEISYRPDLPGALRASRIHPDLVIGRGLDNAEVRGKLIPLDYFFSDMLVSKTDFYPSVLKIGMDDGRRFLLPVSFNLPLVMLPREKSDELTSPVFIGMDEIERMAGAKNRRISGEYSTMGFSPRWNQEFLPVWATLFGARFREGTPLSFDARNFNQAVAEIREFSSKINSSPSDEDEFKFRYLFNPDYRSVAEGRILFATASSRDFFILPEEKRGPLDFRWLADGSRIHLTDDVVSLGACEKGTGKRSSDEFIKWFFKPDVQRRLLERSRKNRSLETSFGFAAGFSSLREVTEKYIPAHYPVLVGKIPSPEQLVSCEALPADWALLRRDVVVTAMTRATDPTAKAEEAASDILGGLIAAYTDSKTLEGKKVRDQAGKP